ncbi:hypothetical protein [Pallidibacillus thermolactis]|jgi:hypothetical protein|uniref:hypothetical protein n=1 Tax=Pallidibacillus thermolactis TaxID=251051 RepID=UPI002E1B44C6|nr:hypothetical protein [Pallidibacillus thermolactis subsp. kokeshiiformis]
MIHEVQKSFLAFISTALFASPNNAGTKGQEHSQNQHWAKELIEFLVERVLFYGMSDGQAPSKNET